MDDKVSKVIDSINNHVETFPNAIIMLKHDGLLWHMFTYIYHKFKPNDRQIYQSHGAYRVDHHVDIFILIMLFP